MYKEDFLKLHVIRRVAKEFGIEGVYYNAQFVAFHMYFADYGLCFLVSIKGKKRDINDFYAVLAKELGEPVYLSNVGDTLNCLWPSGSTDIPRTDLEKIFPLQFEQLFDRAGLDQADKVVIRRFLLDAEDKAGEVIEVNSHPLIKPLDSSRKMKITLALRAIKKLQEMAVGQLTSRPPEN